MSDSYNWVPISGQFRMEDTKVIFDGKLIDVQPIEPSSNPTATPLTVEKYPTFGTILSNQSLAAGTVSAEVTFQDVGPRTTCEIVIGYDVERNAFVAVGITDAIAAFAIREWQPGTPGSQTPKEQPQWIPLGLSGDRSFLKSGQTYRLRVSIRGSRVTLEVNGVPVLTANLRSPILAPRPVGLWCFSGSTVTISNFSVTAERPSAFVVMRFEKPFDDVYANVIKETCSDFGLDTVRADEIYGPGLIIQDIVQQILRSQVVIAEITPENANVYFEVGYALALNKPIVLLARHGTKLPFDVSGSRVLFYEDSIGGKAKLQKGLELHLQTIMGRT